MRFCYSSTLSIAAVILLGLAQRAGAQTTPSAVAPVFAPLALFPSGASASGISPMVAVADFNGDGFPDLATANLIDSQVSVLFSKGNGTFQAPVSYAVDNSPYGIAAGDFNGDGKPDLAVVNQLTQNGGTVSILLNKGSGGLTSSPYLTRDAGYQPYGLTLADVNRDGALDLIIAVTGYREIMVTLNSNNGDGYFDYGGKTYQVGPNTFGMSGADLNGDGYPDIVTWNYYDNTVGVLLNDKTGKFANLIGYPTGSPHIGAFSGSTGDFNGDGIPDVAVVNALDNTVSVLLNDKTGKLLKAVGYPVGQLPTSVLAADLNGDGVLDLGVTNFRDGSVSVLLGKGDGTFLQQNTVPAGTQPYSMVAADFNGDGKADLAVTSFFDNTIGVLLQTGSPATNRMKGLHPRSLKTAPPQ